MSTRLDLSKLSLMDALDLAKLIEMEPCPKYLPNTIEISTTPNLESHIAKFWSGARCGRPLY